MLTSVSGSRPIQCSVLGATRVCLLPAQSRSLNRPCFTGRRKRCQWPGSSGLPHRTRYVSLKARETLPEDKETEKLEDLTSENARLREMMIKKLAEMNEDERKEFLASHEELIQLGLTKGVDPAESALGCEDPKKTATEIKSVVEDAEGNLTFTFEEIDAEGTEKSTETTETIETKSPDVRPRNESAKGLTSSGPSGRFHMGVYSFSTSTIEEAGGSGTKETKETKEMQEKEKGEEKKPVKEEDDTKLSPYDEQAAISQALVDSHDPVKAVKEKSHWLYFMVPETPVAGSDAVLYFNKATSEILRHRPHVQLSVGYNEWELEATPSTLDLAPCQVSREDGSDWWSSKCMVPKDSYEMNFIFSDGEGCYDNNYGQDYTSKVSGRMTRELWDEGADERAALAFQARVEAEKAAALEAEKQHHERMLQQDVDRAQWRVGELKGRFEELRTGAVAALAPGKEAVAWMTSPSPLSSGSTATLSYNLKAGPLGFVNLDGDSAPILKGGFNGWNGVFEKQMKKSSVKAGPGEEWWELTIDIPKDGIVFNFVVQAFEHFDNNNGMDHKVLVGGPEIPPDSWFEGLLVKYKAEETANRIREEERIAEQIARREKVRNEAREKTMAVARRQIKHVLFTNPQVVKAGESVEVFYSSNDTCLNGKEQIYMIGGWNRWTHKRPFGPIKMSPPGKNGNHWQAKVDVPLDAFKMDFVFSDVEGGEGVYDNRGGFDYHLPVEGGIAEEPPLHVVHISVEMAPIAKVGGLGDVVTSLGRAVKEQGHLVEVLLPRYDFFLQSPILRDMVYETEFEFGGTRVFVTTQIVEGLRVFFIEPRNGFFGTQSVYGRNDDAMRFEFFCKAALEFLLQTGRQPDILHCHDWSTADVARTYWSDYHHFGLWKPKVVFTIHNLNYGQIKIGEAAMHSQRFTTVSPTYALEVGGNPAVAPQVGKFMGIRNGIDMDIWDPEFDQFLPMGYTPETVVEGKAAAREALSQRFNLAGWRDVPMIGVISRLTGQKGVHLIKHSAWRALDRGGIFVLLGSAPDPKIQGEFDALAGSIGGDRAAFCFAYDEPLSHLIYAACDMVIVPSMFEPCGLTQMIAMRYGTIPIVRSTGGLHDTVFDVDYDKPRAAWEMEGSSDWKRDDVDETNGFAFEGTDPGALDFAMNRAIDAFYNDRKWFHSLQKRVMEQDWSWNRPALDYIELYFATLKG